MVGPRFLDWTDALVFLDEEGVARERAVEDVREALMREVDAERMDGETDAREETDEVTARCFVEDTAR